MAEKLTATAWTSFAKKRDLDDGAFVKALNKLEGTADDKHDARLAALEEVVSQGNKLVVSLPKKKPPLPDKELREVKDKLHGFIDTAERAQKDVRAAKAAAEAEAEEEADSPVLLTTKMTPLLREVKKGEVQMSAMIALAGKATAVLIMRKTITQARRKLLAEYLDASGGVKYIVGHCLLEDGVVTFVLQAEAAGLAKRINQALLDQTGLRFKVRVRGEDGAVDLAGEDQGDNQGDALATDAPPAPPAPPSPDGIAETKAPTPAELAWKARWPKLRAAAVQVLQQQGTHPDAAKLRTVLGFANEKGEVGGDYAAGVKALDTLETLLKAMVSSPQAAATPTAPAAPTAPGPKTVAPAIVYTQTRLAWVATRGKVKAELDKLEKRILEHYQANDVLPAVVRSVRKLDGVLQMFDESLNDQLDNALNADNPDDKARWHGEARKVIEKYQGYLATDAFVKELDTNPFVPIAVRSTLETTLKMLAAKIA